MIYDPQKGGSGGIPCVKPGYTTRGRAGPDAAGSVNKHNVRRSDQRKANLSFWSVISNQQ